MNKTTAANKPNSIGFTSSDNPSLGFVGSFSLDGSEQPKKRKLEKIQFKDKYFNGEVIYTETKIQYKTSNERALGGFSKTSIASTDEPKEQLIEMVQALLGLLIDSAGLDRKLWEAGKVVGLTFNDLESFITIKIEGECEVEGYFPKVCSPPLKFNEQEYADFIRGLREIETEALAYVDGDRRPIKHQQQELDLEK